MRKYFPVVFKLYRFLSRYIKNRINYISCRIIPENEIGQEALPNLLK